MDDKLVDAANYTLQSGSTIKDDVPKTGDNTPIARLFMIVVISGAGVCCFGRKKKINEWVQCNRLVFGIFTDNTIAYQLINIFERIQLQPHFERTFIHS